MRAKNELQQISEAYQIVQEGFGSALKTGGKAAVSPVEADTAQQNVDPGIENDDLLNYDERYALRQGEQLPELPIVNDEKEAFEALKSTGITGPNNAVKWMTRVIEYNNIEVPPKYRPIEAIVKAAMKRGNRVR